MGKGYDFWTTLIESWGWVMAVVVPVLIAGMIRLGTTRC